MLLQQGHVEAADFRISAADMEMFRALSGDTNPLHFDADFAIRRGFSGPVVYGGLIIAQISRLLGVQMPGHGCVWRAISLRFRAPLYLDEHAHITGTVMHANDELGLLELKLRVDAAGRRIAEGEASAQLAVERERTHA